jgi:hypothetical protein
MAVRIEFVLVNFAPERISVDAQDLGGTRLIAVGAVQYVLDEALFEFTDRLIKEDPTLYHLIDEPFQLIFHDDTLRCKLPVRGLAC